MQSYLEPLNAILSGPAVQISMPFMSSTTVTNGILSRNLVNISRRIASPVARPCMGGWRRPRLRAGSGDYYNLACVLQAPGARPRDYYV